MRTAAVARVLLLLLEMVVVRWHCAVAPAVSELTPRWRTSSSSSRSGEALPLHSLALLRREDLRNIQEK